MTLRTIRFALILLTLIVASVSTSQTQRLPDVEQRVNSLLSQMTLEEKLGQLQQLDGDSNGN
ncbi:MAG TPA: hypothetical protein VKA97_12285, partial [Pyrinomonadaceae bacterium]|nr:hypothetical protein [Pyrinomonadaceae bacterium]